MRGLTRYVGMTVVLAGVLVLSANASIYSTSFENPPFALGSIATQDGWVNGSSSGNSQAIQNSFARTGAQSLKWDNSGALNSFYSVRRSFDGQNGAISPATPLEISAWVYVDQSSGLDRLYGVYAVNSGAGTLGSTNLGLTISGNGTIRAGTTWSSTYSGLGVFTDPRLVGNWVKVVLTYDGVGGGAAVYDASLTEIWSAPYAAVNLVNSNGAGLNSWNINLGADYNGTVARAGIGYHDDLQVRVVPEPSSILAFGVGLVLLTLRRR